MNERAIAQYCRRVGKNLKCGRAQRKRLLGGLAQELLERFGDSPVTQEELLAQVGTPAAAAELLQESVEPEEQAAFEKRRKRLLFSVIGIVLALLAAIMIGYLVYWESHRLDNYSKKIFQGDSFEGEMQGDTDAEIIWGPVVGP